ncbi:hypothetical protein VAR608DRAFT_0736 [Variovorax sp. HW608]|uniref:hypothetical protein n=1 Tax=Variovorax sp. HW608 TaxID=1034889 RepID=UPI00081F840E|nr:hypothetical protein [Variovorax sp. HW608]SCK12823.1 hypothetical protein VAR608DRAFT_0736 [Variovorax sp. HW608]
MKLPRMRRVAMPVVMLVISGCAGSGVFGKATPGWHEAVVVGLGSQAALAAVADVDCSAGVVSDAPFAVARYHGAGVHSRSIGRLVQPSDPPPYVGQKVRVSIHDCSAPFIPLGTP